MNIKQKLKALAIAFVTLISVGCATSSEQQLAEIVANINQVNEKGFFPLHMVVYKGYYDGVQYLVEQGARVNAKAVAPAEAAMRKLHTQTLDEIVQHMTGATPLHIAAMVRHTGIARFLIAQGADINARTNNGNRVLHFAYFASENQPMIDFLLASGADPRALNADDESVQRAAKTFCALQKERIAETAELHSRTRSQEPWIKVMGCRE